MQPLTFVTFTKDEETSKELREVLGANSRVRLLTAPQSVEDLLSDIIRLHPAVVVIHVTAATAEKDFALVKQLNSKNPNTAIIAASHEPLPSLILGSMRAGAREFLELPIIGEELRTVVDRIAEFCATVESSTTKKARVVATFSGKGGAGVSFLATNLGAAMTGPTLIVDLNLQAGDIASFLGLDVKYSLVDL